MTVAAMAKWWTGLSEEASAQHERPMRCSLPVYSFVTGKRSVVLC